MKNKKERIELNITPEEEKFIEKKRKNREHNKRCAEEIESILTKYNCNLEIDPNSPINNIKIVVLPKRPPNGE